MHTFHFSSRIFFGLCVRLVLFCAQFITVCMHRGVFGGLTRHRPVLTTNHGFVRRHSTAVPANVANDDVITPWEVKAKSPKGIDYARVTETFKSQSVTTALLERFSHTIAKVTARGSEQHGGTAAATATRDESSASSLITSAPVLHPFLRRGIAFSHRDVAEALADLDLGKRIYLYTGRGPSSEALHLGHAVPFMLSQYLQSALRVPIVIQLTDDEKFLYRGIPLEKLHHITTANIKDIIAFGFDLKHTFIFRNTDYFGRMYPTVLELQRLMTVNAVRNTLGLDMGGDHSSSESSCNIGQVAFPATQAAPCFVSSFPQVLPVPPHIKKVSCLIPCAIDQDAFFVLTRSLSDRLKRSKPSLLHTTFLPALKGASHKMSSSAEQHGTILLSDSPTEVKKKLRSAFSGGRGTLEELKLHGPDLEADVAYQYLRYFEPSDERVESIARDYKAGVVTSAAVKDAAAESVNTVLAQFQQRRACVTNEDVEKFCSERSIW